MRLDYDNTRTRRSARLDAPENQERKSPLQLFEELYERQNNQPMSEQERSFARDLIKSVWEEKA